MTEKDTALVPAWAQKLPDEFVASAQMVVASGYYPTLKSVAQAGFKMWVAEQLGFTKIEGLQYVHVIEPKEGSSRPPAIHIGYPLVAARIQRSGQYDYRVETDPAKRHIEARVSFWRYGLGGERKLGLSVFTIEDAKRQGLVKQGGNWEKIPETMLFARALTNGARTYCASVLGGVDIGEEDAYVIEGSGRMVESPPQETHGEEFAPANPWSPFWGQVAEMGLTKAQVHEALGVAPEDGALAEAVNAIATENNKTVPQVLAEMLDYLAKPQAPAWEPPEVENGEQGELLAAAPKRKGRDE